MESVVKKKRNQKNSFSLVEMLVVIGIIAILVGLAIPAINAMQKSYNSTGAEGMISAALATARTLAISRGQYAGVRFQKAGDPNNALKADQYMIFVIYEESQKMGGLTNGFRAIEGYKPMKLPENVVVVDMMVRTDNRDGQYGPTNDNANEKKIEEPNLDDSELKRTLTDTSAFSVVFSPAGKLVICDVRVRNKAGDYRPTTPAQSDYDDVFNSPENIMNNVGQLIQDDYADFGLGGEKSRREFYLYDRTKFKNLTTSSQRMIYLNGPETKKYLINAYTGEIIK
jgi:competence protein ComGC